jgi:RNA polymerase sigma factor (sigma-70 family)
MEKRVGIGMACSGKTVGKEPGLKGAAMSFEALVAKLSPTLKRITCKLNGHFTFMDDQDLLQEALIHLWSDFRQGLLGDKTDSYILQGCYFHLKNYIRKSQDSATMLSLNSIMEEDGPHLEEILIGDNLASYDRVEAVLQIEAMGNGTSQRERDVLFFCLEGMTMREIGKKMGISHVSVVKIRNKIRERYQRLNGIAGGNGKTGKSLAA